MKIKPRQYAIALYEATKDLPKAKAEEFLAKFVKILVKNNALGSADRIVEHFIKYANSKEGIVDLKIKTPQPMKEDLVEVLKKEAGRLLGKKLEKTNIQKETDPGLLGGFILECGDTVFDASLKNKFKILKNNLFTKRI